MMLFVYFLHETLSVLSSEKCAWSVQCHRVELSSI